MKREYHEAMNSKEFEKNIAEEMRKAVDFFEKELIKIRTSRAHPSLIEEIRISSYGTQSLLKSNAIITVQDTNVLVIQPFDISLIGEIEKALSQSDLGSQPRNDGKVIKVTIPALSQSRRMELIKTVQKKHEEALTGVRKIRQDIITEIKNAEKGKKISEDLSRRLQKIIQQGVESITTLLETLLKKKEEALLS